MEGEGCNVRGAPTVIDNGISDKCGDIVNALTDGAELPFLREKVL